VKLQTEFQPSLSALTASKETAFISPGCDSRLLAEDLHLPKANSQIARRSAWYASNNVPSNCHVANTVIPNKFFKKNRATRRHKMHKLIVTVLLLGLASSCLGPSRAASAQQNDSASDRGLAISQLALRNEENGQVPLQALADNLNRSLEAIARARNEKGYVRDKKLLRTHAANLKAFGKVLKRSLVATANVDRGNDDSLLRLFHEVRESYYAFEEANDAPNNAFIYVTMDVRESFAAHSASLKRLTEAVCSKKQSQEPGRQSLISPVESSAGGLRASRICEATKDPDAI